MQTILIVLGIAVGVSVQVFVGSLIQSLQKDLVETTVGNSSHVTVVPAESKRTIAGWDDMLVTLSDIDGVQAVSASADAPALAVNGDVSLSVVVRGLVFEDANAIYGIADAVYEGTPPDAGYEVAIGRDAASALGLGVGGSLEIVTSGGGRYPCEVVGLFDLGVAALNRGWALVPLETSQQMFGLGDNVTAIEMQVEDVFAADSIAEDVRAALADTHVEVRNWKDENAQLLSGLQSQSVSSYMIQAFVLTSVVIGIASVLAITVVQKSRQIGILKAMGIRDRDASAIFLFEGLILGAAGAIVGALLGIGLLVSFLTFAKDASGEPIIRIYIDYSFVAMSGIIAVMSATLAALLPARKSSRLNPIEVIRNG